MANLGTMRGEVLASLDAAQDDFSDQLLDKWLREGWDYAISYTEWPFLVDTVTAKIGSEGIVDIPMVRTVRNVVYLDSDRPRVLEAMTPTELRETEFYSRFTGDSPTSWVFVSAITNGMRIRIYPNVQSGDVLIDRVAQPEAFPSSTGGTPDGATPTLPSGGTVPSPLTLAVVNFAISRGFAHLGDLDSSSNYLAISEAGLSRFSDQAVPGRRLQLQVGGGERPGNYYVRTPDRAGLFWRGGRY